MRFHTQTATSKLPLVPLFTKLFAPKSLGQIVTKIPLPVHKFAFEKLLNNVFAEQIEEGEFDFLSSRQLQIEIIDAELFVTLSFNENRLICRRIENHGEEADASLSIDTLSAIQIAEQKVDPDTLFFQRKLKIHGDTELAHHAKNTIDTLDLTNIPNFLIALMDRYRRKILD